MAQAAAEAATQAAAEEAARQAAEQQRQADEAAVRAQNVAAQKAQAEQARMGPSPEILARIQKELAEVRRSAVGLGSGTGSLERLHKAQGSFRM